MGNRSQPCKITLTHWRCSDFEYIPYMELRPMRKYIPSKCSLSTSNSKLSRSIPQISEEEQGNSNQVGTLKPRRGWAQDLQGHRYDAAQGKRNRAGMTTFFSLHERSRAQHTPERNPNMRERHQREQTAIHRSQETGCTVISGGRGID